MTQNRKKMYSYIWIEGEKNLNEFCMKRFGDRPRFMETIGHVSGKGASATIHHIYKYPSDDEPQYSGCHDMYLLYMEHSTGKYYWIEIEKIMRWNYEQIRADRTAILRRRR